MDRFHKSHVRYRRIFHALKIVNVTFRAQTPPYFFCVDYHFHIVSLIPSIRDSTFSIHSTNLKKKIVGKKSRLMNSFQDSTLHELELFFLVLKTEEYRRGFIAYTSISTAV